MENERKNTNVRKRKKKRKSVFHTRKIPASFFLRAKRSCIFRVGDKNFVKLFRSTRNTLRNRPDTVDVKLLFDIKV